MRRVVHRWWGWRANFSYVPWGFYFKTIEVARAGELLVAAIFWTVVALALAANVFSWHSADAPRGAEGWELQKLLLCMPIFIEALALWVMWAIRARGAAPEPRVRAWVTAAGDAVLRALALTPLLRGARVMAVLSFGAGVALGLAFGRASYPAAAVAGLLVIVGTIGVCARAFARQRSGWYDWRYAPEARMLFPSGGRPALRREDIAALEIVAVEQQYRRPVIWYGEHYWADLVLVLASGERMRVLREYSRSDEDEALAALDLPRRFFAEHLGLVAA